MIFKKMREAGILGMNARIGNYILPFNQRKFYPNVDDKVITAELAAVYDIPMPENYLVLESFGEIKNLETALSNFDSFVIKPAKGSKGNGIIVIDRNLKNGFYQKSNGQEITIKYLKDHISEILSGLYSLDGYPDKVIVQHKINLHPFFAPITHQGIPDIRLIIFNGYPVMSMTRLPTSQSDGKANLHQGAVGAGIDIISGTTTYSIIHNKTIDKHPDTHATVNGLEIPFWEQILTMATQGYEMTRLGYLGVDIAIDSGKGPVVIEMNARPGLSIQIANQAGLRKILELFKKENCDLPIEKRIRRAKELLA